MGAEAPAPPCAEAQSSAELFEVCAPPPPPERAHVWPPLPAEQGPRVLPRGECHARGLWHRSVHVWLVDVRKVRRGPS